MCEDEILGSDEHELLSVDLLQLAALLEADHGVALNDAARRVFLLELFEELLMAPFVPGAVDYGPNRIRPILSVALERSALSLLEEDLS